MRTNIWRIILKIFGLRFKFDFCKTVFVHILFFFPGKVYTSLTHSISKAGEKKQPRKKKKTIFTHSHNFFKKVTKIKLFREKKYGTFASGLLNYLLKNLLGPVRLKGVLIWMVLSIDFNVHLPAFFPNLHKTVILFPVFTVIPSNAVRS